eukprot:m51a1_g8445 hypothetical protein (644) ;mRNA; r:382638-384843
MQSVTVNGVKVYNLSSGKSLPDWISEKKRLAQLRKDDQFRRRIELIQDFKFPVASQRVRVSKDGRYVAATGTYPPRIRVYELAQLGLKFERRLDCEITQFLMLSDDYGKMALMHADRTIEFHAQYGAHYRTKLPRVGRDMVYHPPSCDLCLCGSSDEVWRLNLDQGRFLAPFKATSEGLNVGDVNPAHMLLAFGGDGGLVECFDPRARKCVAALDTVPHARAIDGSPQDGDPGVSALAFAADGLTMAVGTNSGQCMLYDLRSSRPYTSKFHQNCLPICSLRFHEGETSRVLSADSKVVKIWDKKNGELLCAVEGSADIRDVCTIENTGIVMMAGEQPRVQTLFIPQLGPAPKWAAFLETLTEELEEAAPSVYADYKFVTKSELEQLGLGRMIGSEYLRAYMHGYFVDARLYARMRAVADPFAYDRYYKDFVQTKIDEQTRSRISAVSAAKGPQVNKELAEELKEQVEQGTAAAEKERLTKGQKARAKAAKGVLEDDRFARMFQSSDFAIDASVRAQEARSDVQRLAALKAQQQNLAEPDERFEEVEDEEEAEDEDEKAAVPQKKKLRLYELKTGHSLQANGSKARAAGRRDMPMAKRVALADAVAEKELGEQRVSSGTVGEREMTFYTKGKKSKGNSRGKQRK